MSFTGVHLPRATEETPAHEGPSEGASRWGAMRLKSPVRPRLVVVPPEGQEEWGELILPSPTDTDGVKLVRVMRNHRFNCSELL